MNHIEAAVAPLKADAMDRAEKFARELVAKATEELAAKGYDLQQVAPYPKAWGQSRKEYMRLHARVKFFEAITQTREGTSYHFSGPHFVDVVPAKVEKFVDETRKDAAFQYDAFVAKLIGKIGPVTEATLEGNHVWGFSHLRVVTVAGERQTWRTQTILNVSKLGKVFNQYPTRRVKA